MQTVHLMGELSQFGDTWETECNTVPDIIKLIDCQTPGFRKYLIDTYEAGGGLDIVRGSDIIVDPAELLLNLHDEDIYLTPIPTGAGKAGKVMLLVGLAIIAQPLIAGLKGGFGAMSFAASGAVGPTMTFAQGFAAGFGTLTMPTLIGINLVLGGLSAILAGGPETEFNPVTDETPGDKLFNGPVNVTKQNIPIPILYGELIVGGVVISGNFRLRDVAATTAASSEISGFLNNTDVTLGDI